MRRAKILKMYLYDNIKKADIGRKMKAYQQYIDYILRRFIKHDTIEDSLRQIKVKRKNLKNKISHESEIR